MKITKQDVKEYEEINGTTSAQDLLILAGPDGFEGDFNELMEELEENYIEVPIYSSGRDDDGFYNIIGYRREYI